MRHTRATIRRIPSLPIRARRLAQARVPTHTLPLPHRQPRRCPRPARPLRHPPIRAHRIPQGRMARTTTATPRDRPPPAAPIRTFLSIPATRGSTSMPGSLQPSLRRFPFRPCLVPATTSATVAASRPRNDPQPIRSYPMYHTPSSSLPQFDRTLLCPVPVMQDSTSRSSRPFSSWVLGVPYVPCTISITSMLSPTNVAP